MSSSTSMEQAKRNCAQASGISNAAYDALAILVNKLQGIAAMEEYKLDAGAVDDQEFLAILDELERRACEDVATLKAATIRLLSADEKR